MNLKPHLFPVTILLVVTFVFSLSMLFCPGSSEAFGHDAGVFAYIGYAVTQGEPLYTGAWDNKGPLLYLINALGIALNYRYGIYVLEFAALFSTLLFFYKTALLFTTRYVAVISVILAVIPLTVTLEGGNLSEEWALPFTAIALFYIAKFFCNEYNLKRYAIMIIGACIAAISLLRLNIVVFTGVAALGVIITLIKNGQLKKMASFVVFAFCGFVILIAPIAIYLMLTGSLIECLDSAYFGAVGSFTNITMKERAVNVLSMISTFAKNGGLLLVLFIAIFPFYLYKTKKEKTPLKTLLLICFIGLFVNLGANSLSGAPNMHYFMTFIPIMLLPIVWFANAVYLFFKQNQASPFAATAVVVAIALFISLNSIADLKNAIVNNANPEMPLTLAKATLTNYIESNSQSGDVVQVFGDPTLNYGTKRKAASNYFYYANGWFSDDAKTKFANEIMSDIMNEQPKLIIFDEEKMQDFMEHLDNPEEMDSFLDTYYEVDKQSLSSYITYILK